MRSGGENSRGPLKGIAAKPKLRRTGHVTIRLSPDERAFLDAASAQAGLMNGSYLRQLIFGAPRPRQVRRPPVERQELARLLGHFGSIGNNLNQIARVLNSGEEINDAGLRQAIDDLHVMRDAVLTALNRAP